MDNQDLIYLLALQKSDGIGDINATGLIYGNGSQLTDISTSAIDLSEYVLLMQTN